VNTGISVRVLHASRYDRSWNYPALAAPYWRFYWNSEGVARVVACGRTIPIDPREAFLIPPDTQFSSQSDGAIDHFFVHFTVRGLGFDVRPGVYRLPHGQLLAPLVETLRTDPPHCSGIALAALAQLPPHAQIPAPADPVVQRAVRFVERNLHRPVTAAEFARACGTGERSLRRRFVAAIGRTPAAFATLRRVEHACILLHFTAGSIDDIAHATGFCDRYHLTRVFRRLRGMGPAAFRRIALETNPTDRPPAESAPTFP